MPDGGNGKKDAARRKHDCKRIVLAELDHFRDHFPAATAFGLAASRKGVTRDKTRRQEASSQSEQPLGINAN